MGAPEAHPRAYGEYDSRQQQEEAGHGSSPCIRGILLFLIEGGTTLRLIPVHTGNTECKPVGKDVPSAHPRAYGEYPYKLEQVI